MPSLFFIHSPDSQSREIPSPKIEKKRNPAYAGHQRKGSLMSWRAGVGGENPFSGNSVLGVMGLLGRSGQTRCVRCAVL